MDSPRLQTLIDQSAFLYERMTDRWQPYEDPFSRALAQQQLDHWSQVVAGGDGTRFAQRLAWDGLSLEQAEAIAGPGRLAQASSLPPWVTLLVRAEEQERGGPLVALAQTARQMLTEETDVDLFSPPAWESVTGYLDQRLAELAGPTLTAVDGADLAALMENYPVLVRQLATLALNWIGEVQEVLNRLARGGEALGAGVGPGMVAQARPGLSDPHGGGRTVWQITLSNGAVWAYKPKDLGMDQAWDGLLAWLNQRDDVRPFARVTVLPRSGYGWMGWAEEGPPGPDYFMDLGRVLGLLELVHAADCHRENLIVHRGSPVLIDGEMIGYPQMAGLAGEDSLNVMRTGILPRWEWRAGEWQTLSALPPEMEPSAEQIAQIEEGYEGIWALLNQHWTDLSGPDGPLAALRREAVRLAPRPTAAYARLLDHVRNPAALGDGMDFSIQIERLAATLFNKPLDPEQAAFLLRQEHQALSQRDVPVFHARPDQPWLGGDLRWPSSKLNDPPAQAVAKGLIQASLESPPFVPSFHRMVSFMDVSQSLGVLLVDRAVEVAEEEWYWTDRQYQPHAGLYQHGLIGDDFYAGRAGIGLFFAALTYVAPNNLWRTAALAALPLTEGETQADSGGLIYALSMSAFWLRSIECLERAMVLAYDQPLSTKIDDVALHDEPHGWGIIDGEAGLICGLLALHFFTEEREVLARAVAAGDRLLAGAFQWRDEETGLGGMAHGAAGIGLALLRLYRASGEERFLTEARAAWTFQQSLFDDPPGNWQDRRGTQSAYLHNWCHGAAGIGLAAIFCADEIEGAVGIVERAGSLLSKVLPDYSLGAIPSPILPEGDPLDTLCCGRFGEIESLSRLGTWMRMSGHRRDNGWSAQAVVAARHFVQEASATGHFVLNDTLPEDVNPSFFRGLAGIGYFYLRQAIASGASSRMLPSVLAMSWRWDEALKR